MEFKFRDLEELDTLEKLENEMKLIAKEIEKEKENEKILGKLIEHLENREKSIESSIIERSIGTVRFQNQDLYLMADDNYNAEKDCYIAPAVDLEGNCYNVIWDSVNGVKDSIDRYVVWSA